MGVKLQALQFATIHAKNATAPLVKNRFKIKKNTTVTQFKPSVKATFPPWGFVADALKRCVAKKSAKCPCKQRHLFFVCCY